MDFMLLIESKRVKGTFIISEARSALKSCTFSTVKKGYSNV